MSLPKLLLAVGMLLLIISPWNVPECEAFFEFVKKMFKRGVHEQEDQDDFRNEHADTGNYGDTGNNNDDVGGDSSVKNNIGNVVHSAYNCLGYICPRSRVCVNHPSKCPCPPLHIKCKTGDWYVCIPQPGAKTKRPASEDISCNVVSKELYI